MIRRCNNPNDDNYYNYGALGIKVCKKWLTIEGFLEDMGMRPKGKTLDRIDSTGDYCKDNCKWSTPKEQSNNTKSNIFIKYKGRVQTVMQWSEELGIHINTLYQRLKRGNYSLERTMSKEKYGKRNA